MEGAGLGQLDLGFQDWLGEDIWAVGAELCPCQFDWQLGAFSDIVERNPGDVMLDRVGVRDAGADRDFDLDGLAGLEWREERYNWHVLFGFPVGGFDE